MELEENQTFGEVDEAQPVCHVSCYEADAYARRQFSGIRLARDV